MNVHYSVNKLLVYIAPKIFGGSEAKSPVAGKGVAMASKAYNLYLKEIKTIGQDILLEYDVKKAGE